MKKQHKNALSKTTLKAFNSSKYNKVVKTVSTPDPAKEYHMFRDGWRRKTPKK